MQRRRNRLTGIALITTGALCLVLAACGDSDDVGAGGSERVDLLRRREPARVQRDGAGEHGGRQQRDGRDQGAVPRRSKRTPRPSAFPDPTPRRRKSPNVQTAVTTLGSALDDLGSDPTPDALSTSVVSGIGQVVSATQA